MAETPKPSSSSNREVLFYVVTAVVVAAVVILPSLVAGLAAWWFSRGRVRRVEYLIVTLATLALWAARAPQMTADYLSWVWALTPMSERAPWPAPLLEIANLAVFVFGAAGLASGSKLARKAVDRSGALAKLAGMSKGPLGGRDTIVPDEKLRNRAKIATPTGGLVAPRPSDHSIMKQDEFGKREISIGLDEHQRPVLLSEHELGMHGLMLGSTGSGKTVSIQSFAAALLDLGWDGMILDLKEDTATGGFRDFLDTYAAAHAIPFQQLALSDPNPQFWFNPLAQMGPDEARDTILSLSAFDDEFWQNVNKKVLGQLVTLVYAAHDVDPVQFTYPTMYEIGKLLGSGNLPNATKAMRACVEVAKVGFTRDDFSALAQPSQDEAKSAVGFGAKLTQIYETQAGRTVLRAGGDKRMIDVTAPGLTYIGLDTQGKEDMSRMVSSAVLQRMSVYAAQRTTGAMAKGKPRFLIVDEANWVHRQIVKNILSRARSAGIMLVLATQGPDDWIDKNGDDWSVMVQNVNWGIIMAQGSPQAAEMCAEWLGKSEVTSASAQFRDGQLIDSGSVRQTIDYLVQPHLLRNMAQGEAFFRVNKPVERVGYMSVKIRDPKAQFGR